MGDGMRQGCSLTGCMGMMTRVILTMAFRSAVTLDSEGLPGQSLLSSGLCIGAGNHRDVRRDSNMQSMGGWGGGWDAASLFACSVHRDGDEDHFGDGVVTSRLLATSMIFK